MSTGDVKKRWQRPASIPSTLPSINETQTTSRGESSYLRSDYATELKKFVGKKVMVMLNIISNTVEFKEEGTVSLIDGWLYNVLTKHSIDVNGNLLGVTNNPLSADKVDRFIANAIQRAKLEKDRIKDARRKPRGERSSSPGLRRKEKRRVLPLAPERTCLQAPLKRASDLPPKAPDVVMESASSTGECVC